MSRCCENLFVKSPFTIDVQNYKKELSSKGKALVIALTIFAAICTGGLGAPFAFFGAAKWLRDKEIKKLSLRQAGSNDPMNKIEKVKQRQIPIEVTPSIKDSMSTHIFEEGEVKNGKLYYQGDVPVLELNADDPHAAGVAHGFLTAHALSGLFKKLKEDGTIPADLAKNLLSDIDSLPASLLKDKPQLKNLQDVFHLIPKEYLQEMKGIVEGYNQWISENKLSDSDKLTLPLLLFLHLIPDSLHFNVGNSVGETVGCTVVVENDPAAGPVVGRTLDWNSHEVFGTHSLAIHRKYGNGKDNTINIGIPGLAGTLTGMNQAGVLVAMNVCQGKTHSIKGMPAVFFNRVCLDGAKGVQDVADKILHQSPLGSYHLSVADESQATAFHFFQGKNQTHVQRKKTENQPFIVTNCRYPSVDDRENHMFYSQEREEKIQKLFKEHVVEPRLSLVKQSLELTPVNNGITIHKIIARPKTKEIEVAFANSSAGSLRLRPINWD